MTEMDWIRSYGGPLICMDNTLKESWGGIARLTDGTTVDADNDYDRACQCSRLLTTISLRGGNALVLGDHPLNTSFWRAEDGQLHIVRLRWAEPSTDIHALLSAADISLLSSVETDVSVEFAGMDIVLFDSVEDGQDNNINQRHTFARGKQKVSTKIFEPDDRTSMYIHAFEAH